MATIKEIIDEIYAEEEKQGSVWARHPTQREIDRVPGLLSKEVVLRVSRQSIVSWIPYASRTARNVLCWFLVCVATQGAEFDVVARLSFLLIVCWLIWFAVTIWGWHFNLLAVTNMRVIIREGWLARRIKPIRLTQIQNATIKQREHWMVFLDVGHIVLEVLAEDDPHFFWTPEPFEFRRLLQYVRVAQKKTYLESEDSGLWLGDYL